jgi:hypothetical protein
LVRIGQPGLSDEGRFASSAASAGNVYQRVGVTANKRLRRFFSVPGIALRLAFALTNAPEW